MGRTLAAVCVCGGSGFQYFFGMFICVWAYVCEHVCWCGGRKNGLIKCIFTHKYTRTPAADALTSEGWKVKGPAPASLRAICCCLRWCCRAVDRDDSQRRAACVLAASPAFMSREDERLNECDLLLLALVL